MNRLKQAIPSIIILVVLILIAVMFQPGPSPAGNSYYHMGTRFMVKTRDRDDELELKAHKDLDNLFAAIEGEWHPDRVGAIGKANEALQNGHSVILPASTHALFKQAKVLQQRSNGFFDPGIGALTNAWGFSKQFAEAPVAPPAADRLKALLAPAHSIAQATLDQDGLLTAPKGMRLDFGAFIKGYAVDAAIERLKMLGIKHAIVDGGGDLRVLGNHVQRPWRMGIRNPKWKEGDANSERAIIQVELRDGQALFTSGNYERKFAYEGKLYHHLLDPFTGYPVNDFSSVSVITNNGAEADAAATALFVAGKAHWRDVAKALNIKQFVLIDNDNNIIISKAMSERSRIMLSDITVEKLDLDAPPLEATDSKTADAP